MLVHFPQQIGARLGFGALQQRLLEAEGAPGAVRTAMHLVIRVGVGVGSLGLNRGGRLAVAGGGSASAPLFRRALRRWHSRGGRRVDGARECCAACRLGSEIVADRPDSEGYERRTGSDRSRVADEAREEGMSGRRGHGTDACAYVLALQPGEGVSEAIQRALSDDEAQSGADDQLSHAHDQYRACMVCQASILRGSSLIIREQVHAAGGCSVHTARNRHRFGPWRPLMTALRGPGDNAGPSAPRSRTSEYGNASVAATLMPS